MSRNYGLGSRCMYKAGKFALKKSANERFISFQTAADISDRWRLFCEYAEKDGVKQMEFVTEELLLKYGKMLAKLVEDKKLKESTAQNRVSAVNTVMKYVKHGDWISVKPTDAGECAIKKRSYIRTTPPSGMDREQLLKSISDFNMNDIALVMLIRDFGLRSKEASLLNAEIALDQALKNGYIYILKGTKGGRVRRLKIISRTQIETLKYATEAQGNRKNLITGDQSWKTWREETLRAIREALQLKDVKRLHELRAAYACGRYKELTDHDAPVLDGCAPKVIDRWARLIIAEELGHSRIDITNAYLGAMT